MNRESFLDTRAPTTAEWAGANGRRWASVAERIESQLEPVSDVLFEHARLAPGERVLDVGCGRGVTTRRAATEVDPGGSVTGVDVAENLIAEARKIPAEGVPISWQVGDAQRQELAPDHHDAVISRFGVMFFDDPMVAFGNLATTTRPGGRLALVVWQARDRSAVLQRTLDVAAKTVSRLGYDLELPPADAGPFAYGDPGFARELLEESGWTDVEIHPRSIEMYACGPGTVEEIVEIGFTIGPLHAALVEAPDAVRAAVRDALVEELTPLHDGTGVQLAGAIAILTARR